MDPLAVLTATLGPETASSCTLPLKEVTSTWPLLMLPRVTGPLMVRTCTCAFLTSRTSTWAASPSTVTSPRNFSAVIGPLGARTVTLASVGTSTWYSTRLSDPSARCRKWVLAWMRLPVCPQSTSTLSEWVVATITTWWPAEPLTSTGPDSLVTTTLAPGATV